MLMLCLQIDVMPTSGQKKAVHCNNVQTCLILLIDVHPSLFTDHACTSQLCTYSPRVKCCFRGKSRTTLPSLPVFKCASYIFSKPAFPIAFSL